MLDYDTVVLVNAEGTGTRGSYPDALGAGPGAAVNGYPILFVKPNAIPDATMKLLSSGKVDKAYIIGGTSVVDRNVEALVKTKVKTVVRLGGANREETCILVQKEFFPANQKYNAAFAATGWNFADALTGGVAAAKMGCPLVLVHPTNVPVTSCVSEYLNAIEPVHVVIFGGDSVVSYRVKAALELFERK